ncbi:adenosylmethionine decarboxylase [Bacteroidota bacterium]
MNQLGTQHVAEFFNCKEDILNDVKSLEKIVLKSIIDSQLSHEKIISHKFKPIGVTVLAIISESHIGLHTYPESGHVSLDVFTCSNPLKQIEFIKSIKKQLKPQKVSISEIQRGTILELKNRNWITSKSDTGFEIKYFIKKHLYKKKSKYQMIDVIENPIFERMLFLDKDLQISERDANEYNKSLIDPIRELRKKIKSAAILGGGDGGILFEILKLNPTSVTLIDIDEHVIKVSKKYLNSICHNSFEDPRVKIITKDAITFIQQDLKFDAIIYDLTMHPEAFTKVPRSKYLDDLFFNIKKRLNKKGILTLQVSSEYDKDTFKIVRKILSKHFADIKYENILIPSFCEHWIFASAKLK